MTINADAVKESPETFTVNLSNPTGGPAIAFPTGTGRIFDPGNLFTVTPCRLADTRGAEGPALSPGADRVFAVSGRCGVPATARSASVNVTVTGGDPGRRPAPLRGGHRSRPSPRRSTTRANQTRANNAFVPLGASGQLAVTPRPGRGQRPRDPGRQRLRGVVRQHGVLSSARRPIPMATRKKARTKAVAKSTDEEGSRRRREPPTRPPPRSGPRPVRPRRAASPRP